MKFCTAVTCMDGRIQLPVIHYLQKRFGAEFVDVITEAGPNGILAEGRNHSTIESILYRLKISVEAHNSVGIAIVGHHDCAGNPTCEGEQQKHTKQAIEFIKDHYPDVEIIGLWVGENWQAQEIPIH